MACTARCMTRAITGTHTDLPSAATRRLGLNGSSAPDKHFAMVLDGGTPRPPRPPAATTALKRDILTPCPMHHL